MVFPASPDTTSSRPSEPPTITLLYFASIRTSLDGEPSSETLALPESPSPLTLSDLRTWLVRTVHDGNEAFRLALERSAWSVDEEMVAVEDERDVVLTGGETVCAIPPVSGG
ncbi:hypothetical protein JCM10212_004542 [Sporobolomyces blumeae]